MRCVWAGDQVLWELRAPGADGDNLESTTAAGASEPRFYGRVSYLHAGGIDRPLSIWKEGVGSVRFYARSQSILRAYRDGEELP